MKAGLPAWIPVLLYICACFFFAEPLAALRGLVCALVLFFASETIGQRILRRFGDTNITLAVPLGLGSILLIVFAIGSWDASPPVLVAIWIALALVAIPSIHLLRSAIPYYWLWGIPFFIVAFWSSFTPTTFYDALAYNLGLPYQYLAYERISTFSTWTTSYFPPFDQIQKFLFLAVAPQNAIKLFSLLLYIQTLRIMVSFRPQQLESKHIVIPLLLFPVPWILLHIINPDLLNSFFFVAGICALLRAATIRSIVLGTILLGFTFWTKYTMYPYIVAVPLVLWHRRVKWKDYLQRVVLCGTVFVLLLSPLYIRNIVLKNDPLYPLLHSVFPSDWQAKQTEAVVRKEFPLPKTFPEFARRVVLTPFWITFNVRSYGSASEVGFLPLLGFLLLPFCFRKLNRRLMLFLFLCYLIWIHELYHFRYFLPIYILSLLVVGHSFQFLSTTLRRFNFVLWVVAAGYGLYVTLPVLQLFPLRSPGNSVEEYLSARVSYYDAAQYLNAHAKGERTIMVGETRNAYILTRLIPFSYTDPDALLRWSREVKSAEDLYRKLKQERVGYILHNPAEMNRLAKQYGIWKATPEQNAMISQMLREHGKLAFSKNGILLIRIQ